MAACALCGEGSQSVVERLLHVWPNYVTMITLLSHTVILLVSPPDTSMLPRKRRHLTYPI